MSIRKVICAFISVLVLAGLAACGEDSEGVSVETGTLSKAEFVKRADSLCKATREKFTRDYTAFYRTKVANNKDALKNPEPLSRELVSSIFVPIFEKEVDDLAAIGAPAGDEEEVSAFLTALQERIEEIEDEPLELTRTIKPLKRPERLARAYGLDGCADSYS